jgi:hypothetical protein
VLGSSAGQLGLQRNSSRPLPRCTAISMTVRTPKRAARCAGGSALNARLPVLIWALIVALWERNSSDSPDLSTAQHRLTPCRGARGHGAQSLPGLCTGACWCAAERIGWHAAGGTRLPFDGQGGCPVSCVRQVHLTSPDDQVAPRDCVDSIPRLQSDASHRGLVESGLPRLGSSPEPAH